MFEGGDGWHHRDFEKLCAEFAKPDELSELRRKIDRSKKDLEVAIEEERYDDAARLRDEIRTLSLRDPGLQANALEVRLKEAVDAERYPEAAQIRDELLSMKRYLPQYNLAGLWMGLYPNAEGDPKPQLVRIAYQGSKLIATKVTGDEHVPAGQVTFTVDLSKPSVKKKHGENESMQIEVYVRDEEKGGDEHKEEYVEMYHGEGQVAGENFTQPHFVDGALAMMGDDLFGFMWLPYRSFVFFVRQSDKADSDGPGVPKVKIIRQN